MRILAIVFLVALCPVLGLAKGGGGHSGGHGGSRGGHSGSSHSGHSGSSHGGTHTGSTHSGSTGSSSHHTTNTASSHSFLHFFGSSGRASPEQQFQKSNPCPVNNKKSGKCPGYVVDRVTPLDQGGTNIPSNMRWRAVDASPAAGKIP